MFFGKGYAIVIAIVVPAFLGTVKTGILEGLASGTSQDVPSSPSISWDCQDWDFRGASFWDFPGSQVVPAFLGTMVRTGILEGLTYGTCWDVLSSPRACWDDRTVRGNPRHL